MEAGEGGGDAERDGPEMRGGTEERGGGKGQSAWQLSMSHAATTRHRLFQKTRFGYYGFVAGLLTNIKIGIRGTELYVHFQIIFPGLHICF